MNVRQAAKAISSEEFEGMLHKCKPPSGWFHDIAVANSGGPDSTCLLFLLHRYQLKRRYSPLDSGPRSVISLTVNHALQPSSSLMADSCSRVARSLGAKHATATIPWGTSPFPSRPKPGESFENTARLARYHLLFSQMREQAVDILALGHHGDDQVETALMRLGRGTSALGAGAMRRCRRWGMGQGKHGDLGWTGFEGMNKWIIRPLLDVGKDRILATCEENGLEFVTDPTNFQPEVTLRNAIRHLIKRPEEQGVVTEKLPFELQSALADVETAVSALKPVPIDMTSGLDELRCSVQLLSSRVDEIDGQVDNALNLCSSRAPPGTFLLLTRPVLNVKDNIVQRALILRIMRYVSFHPWGSVAADGGRRHSSLQRIIEKVWTPNPFAHGLARFTAGGGVIWTPVVVRRDRIRTPNPTTYASISTNEAIGWLASRQPPSRQTRLDVDNTEQPLVVDITDALVQHKQLLQSGKRKSILELMYDSRFLVRFDFAKIPDTATFVFDGTRRIFLEPVTQWFWPRVVSRRKTTRIHKSNDCSPLSASPQSSNSEVADILHSDIPDMSLSEQEKVPDSWTPEPYPRSPWISVTPIRTLSAI